MQFSLHPTLHWRMVATTGPRGSHKSHPITAHTQYNNDHKSNNKLPCPRMTFLSAPISSHPNGSSHFHLNLSESSAALQTGNDVLCRYDHMILHIPSKIPGQSQLPDLAHPCNLATSPPGDPYSLASHPEKQRMVEKETLTNQHQQTTSNSDILLTAALDHIHHDPHPLPRDDSPGPGVTALACEGIGL